MTQRVRQVRGEDIINMKQDWKGAHKISNSFQLRSLENISYVVYFNTHEEDAGCWLMMTRTPKKIQVLGEGSPQNSVSLVTNPYSKND